MNMACTTNTTKFRRYHNAWLLDSGASVHMCNSRATFTEYRVLESPTDIQSMGGPVQAIGIGTAYVSFILAGGTTTDALLQETFHVPDLFTNLISLGVLLKKAYSFDTRIFYVLDKSNRQVAYAPLQDKLFPVKMANERAKQSKPKKFDLFAPQGGAPTSDQGVIKSAMPVVRNLHDFWHRIWRNGCAPVGA